jgi:hypothetical protein
MSRVPEQRAVHRPMPQRNASARPDEEVASPHRAGHYSGLHPEDQPYQTDDVRDPRRALRHSEPIPVDDEYGYEGDQGYDDPPRLPSSVRRYQSMPLASPRSSGACSTIARRSPRVPAAPRLRSTRHHLLPRPQSRRREGHAPALGCASTGWCTWAARCASCSWAGSCSRH